VFSEQATKFLQSDGQVSLQAYTLASTSLTTLQMLAPLRAQLEAEGFRTQFACADSVCGGFDFRFTLDLLPEPAMHVDLGNFQYLVAQHDDGRTAAIITSNARTSGFIHITSVTPNGQANASIEDEAATVTKPSLPLTPTQKQLGATVTQALIDEMISSGSVVLDDLVFATGTSSLGDGDFASLATLAAFLKANPTTRIALVGHTDATGSLAGNITLSRRRAASVRSHLITIFDASPDQISAEGIGYLAPRANNSDNAGREQNRRVEAVLTSTL
jgi:OOP family OmpA-OmpF porin